jgi:hypothetical protein
MTKNEALTFDRNLALLCAKESWFAPVFTAARQLLNTATIDGDLLRFPHGITCGPHGCDCGNSACLHRPARRIAQGAAS